MPEPLVTPVPPVAPAAPAASSPVAPAADPAGATPPAPVDPPAAVTPPAATPPAPNPWEDPKVAEAEIKRLRGENAKDRTDAKAQAAEDARKELAASIGKILDPTATEPTDPAALAQQVTTSQAETKQARVELAVFRNATAANGDAAALLDSTSFLKSLEAIDPNDSAAVTAAITSAVAANPRLGAAPTAPADPRAPAPNPAQGASAGGAPGLDAQIADAEKAGNHTLAISLKRQKAALKA